MLSRANALVGVQWLKATGKDERKLLGTWTGVLCEDCANRPGLIFRRQFSSVARKSQFLTH